MDYIEVSAKTVNDAIMKACMDLSVPSDQLDIQVVSEGSRGFLGIGNKPAVIKVRVKKEEVEEKKEVVPPSKEIKEKKEAKEIKEVKESKEASSESSKPEKVREKRDFDKNKNRRKDFNKKNRKPQSNERREERRPNIPEKKHEVKEKEEIIVKTDEEIMAMKDSATKFLTEVFEAMDIKADLNMNYNEKGGYLEINFSGDDNGVLIGKRGQTLDSLQYLTSLVVNKTQKEYVRIKLDTEDYRRRRRDTLENLAKNIANKVKKTGKTVVLEPMNPYERRIIHSALQPNKYVETYSEGNEPYRHVVVTLKK